MSGKYNLRKIFSEPRDYIEFYKKRFMDIVFPYIIVSLILSLWNVYAAPDPKITASSRLVYYLKYAFDDMFTKNSSTHLWFLFLLMGYILSAPFLSHMFHSMSDNELHVFWRIVVIYNVIKIFLFANFDHVFLWGGGIFDGMIVYFYLGYYLDRVVTDTNIKKYYLAGTVCAILNYIGIILGGEKFTYSHNLAPTYMIACIAGYLFVENNIFVENEQIRTVIIFLAKHSFTALMVHYNIINYFIYPETVKFGNKYPVLSPYLYLMDLISTILLSYGVALILDFIIRRLKNILMVCFEKLELAVERR